MAGRDDALSWDEDDPTLDIGTGRRRAGADPDDADADDADAAATPASRPAPSAPEDHRGLSSTGLLALGVLGGVYLLFAIGWLIGGLRLQPAAGFLVASDGNASPLWTAGNAVALWLAVLSPPIWFGAVFWLTARSRPWLRWLLLGIGVVLLVPWPFVMVGTVGA